MDLLRQQCNHQQRNPFQTLESEVKSDMAIATAEGLQANPDLKLNVCGQQVSCDQPSIEFCQAQNFHAISVPANRTQMLTSSIIAGQEAYKSREKAKQENAAWRKAGGKSLQDVGVPQPRISNTDILPEGPKKKLGE